MTRLSLAIVAAVTVVATLTFGFGANAESQDAKGQDTKGKVCRMEQQCHWENFKKICTYVKVCR
jgi:hypothetical protein